MYDDVRDVELNRGTWRNYDGVVDVGSRAIARKGVRIETGIGINNAVRALR